MKAVILAGGLGTRMREETEYRPKPMVEIGGKPILWHIMMILATQGISDFIICVGYKQEIIKEFFLNLRELTQDFTIDFGKDGEVQFFETQNQNLDWRVTVVDTGPLTMTGGRVKLIEPHVGGEPFLITYGDGVADVNINELLASHNGSNALLTLTTCSPSSRFGVVTTQSDGLVTAFAEKPQMQEKVNIGYMVAEPEIFEYLRPDSILETEPLQQLAKERKLHSYHHQGYWRPMDTQREAQILNEEWAKGAPWKIWT